MGCICQQVIVVTDLDENLRTSGFLQVLMVPAGIPQRTVFLANLGDAHLPPVKSTETGYRVQIIIGAKREQGFHLLGILFLIFHRFQTLGKANVTDKAFLALSHHRPDGLLNDAVLQKNPGQKWNVFPDDSVLQGNAGGGNHHRLGTGRSMGRKLFQ